MDDRWTPLVADLRERFATDTDSVEVEAYLAAQGYDRRQIGEILTLLYSDIAPAQQVASGDAVRVAPLRVQGPHERGRFTAEAWGYLVLLGASGAVMAIATVSALLFPRRTLLVFFILPLPDGPGRALTLTVHPVRDHLPIYLAAIGPKNLELAGEIADGLHIAVELLFLIEQTLDQGAAIGVLVQAAQQEVPEGAQGREGVAQLMHQKPQMFFAGQQAGLESLPLDVDPQGLGEGKGHGLEALAQAFGPNSAQGFHLQGPQ
jgi:hypothetical protein